MVEAPEVGVHPRHFCIELDPETQSILAVGMGPRAKDTKGVALAATVTDRLKRRLRSKGFRAAYTLQMVCRGGVILMPGVRSAAWSEDPLPHARARSRDLRFPGDIPADPESHT